MKITVETCCGIAFANGKEELAKGQWGRDFALLQHAIRHERAGIPIKRLRHLCAAGRDRFQFSAFEVSATAQFARSPIGKFVIQREDTR